MADFNRCPECGAKIYRDDFQCARCELLLHPEQATGEYVVTEPSIVRALIAPPDAHPTGEIPVVLGEDEYSEIVTESFKLPLSDDDVPKLVAELDIALKPLHPYEALVASFIDGKSTVKQLLAVSRIPPIELKAVLASLADRGVVELARGKTPPPKKPKVGQAPPVAKKPIPISEVPTNPRRPKAKPGAFSAALGATATPNAEPAKDEPIKLQSRLRVEQALAAAKKKSNEAKPSELQERAPALPERPDEYLQRAVQLEREGRVDGAIYVLKRAIAQVKRPAPLYNKLALILLNQRQDYREAELLLRKALAADPQNGVYQQNLYTVLAMAAEHKSGKKDASGLWAKLRGK